MWHELASSVSLIETFGVPAGLLVCMSFGLNLADFDVVFVTLSTRGSLYESHTAPYSHFDSLAGFGMIRS